MQSNQIFPPGFHFADCIFTDWKTSNRVSPTDHSSFYSCSNCFTCDEPMICCCGSPWLERSTDIWRSSGPPTSRLAQRLRNDFWMQRGSKVVKMTKYFVVKLKEGYCAGQLVREAPFLMNFRSNGHGGVKRLPGWFGALFCPCPYGQFLF